MSVFIPFPEFLAAWAGRTKVDFLAHVRTPYFAMGPLADTPAEVVGMLETDRVEPSRAVAFWGMQMLVPVAPRDPAATRVYVGREPTNDIVIPDTRVSKVQAWVERHEDGTWLLGDDGSTNGTRVDLRPVPTTYGVPLASGARVRLGESFDLVFLEPRTLFGVLTRLRRVCPEGKFPAPERAEVPGPPP